MNEKRKVSPVVTEESDIDWECEEISDFDNDFIFPIKENKIKRQNAVMYEKKEDVENGLEEVRLEPENNTNEIIEYSFIEDKKAQGVRWCITINNPEKNEVEMKEYFDSKDEIKGYIFQKEKGKQNTIHYQCYIELKSRIRFGKVKEIIGGKGHLSQAKGSKLQNIAYCSKEESRLSGPYFGGCVNPKDKKSGEQGKRNDLAIVMEKVLEDGEITAEAIVNNAKVFAQFGHGVQRTLTQYKLLKAQEEEMKYWAKVREEGLGVGQKQRDCIMLFGPTGVGKTTAVKIETLGKKETLYEKAGGDNKFFDGLSESHDNVLIDEFRGQKAIQLGQLLQITNIGTTSVEVKGGSVMVGRHTKFWFGSNRHPCQWYGGGYKKAEYKALMRRFKEVWWWKTSEADSKEILTNPGLNDNTDEWKTKSAMWNHFWRGPPEHVDIEGKPVVEFNNVESSASTESYFDF